MRSALRKLCLAAALAALGNAGSARAEGVALTFDDAPAMALAYSPAYAGATTARLLRGLRRHHWPATAFVIGGRVDGPDRAAYLRMLDRWLNAGMELGNHTYSHESLNKTPLADYIADVDRDDALLRPLLARRGQTPRWFRHPYLDTGSTPQDKQGFEAWLAAHGYRVAPVTMENADWMFAAPYDDAIGRHDRQAAARIRTAYLQYTAKVLPWYRQAALELLGRRPSFVLLLHVTRLNADTVDDLAAILRANALQPVSLGRAMADPAYRIEEAELDLDGDEWLSRWSQTLHKELPWDSFPEPPADIAAENDRLDVAP